MSNPKRTSKTQNPKPVDVKSLPAARSIRKKKHQPKKRGRLTTQRSVLLVCAPLERKAMGAIVPPHAKKGQRIVLATNYDDAVKLLQPTWDEKDIALQIEERLPEQLKHLDPEITAKFVRADNHQCGRIAFFRGGQEIVRSEKNLNRQIIEVTESIERSAQKAPFDAVVIQSSLPESKGVKTIPHIHLGLSLVVFAECASIKHIAVWMTQAKVCNSSKELYGGAVRIFDGTYLRRAPSSLEKIQTFAFGRPS